MLSTGFGNEERLRCVLIFNSQVLHFGDAGALIFKGTSDLRVIVDRPRV
jgi:hypothetical protein